MSAGIIFIKTVQFLINKNIMEAEKMFKKTAGSRTGRL